MNWVSRVLGIDGTLVIITHQPMYRHCTVMKLKATSVIMSLSIKRVAHLCLFCFIFRCMWNYHWYPLVFFIQFLSHYFKNHKRVAFNDTEIDCSISSFQDSFFMWYGINSAVLLMFRHQADWFLTAIQISSMINSSYSIKYFYPM